ncbi:MAG: hypothetical protein WBW98_17815 [Candidatus Sulfotelmatobacter sp.]|jgi:hypothetical protein
MKFCQRVAIFLGIAMCSFAQSTPVPVYAESFRQGSTRVIEERFEAKLTPQDPTYRERIKDSHWTDRYALSITPQGPEGDTEITSWQVKLVDLHYTMYDNVLLTSQDPSSDPKDDLWRLNPSSFSQVPVAAKRIIRVDSFYVILQIKAYHFTPPDSPYLDSMTVAVEFTNTDPRTTAENPRK